MSPDTRGERWFFYTTKCIEAGRPAWFNKAQQAAESTAHSPAHSSTFAPSDGAAAHHQSFSR